MCSSRGLRRFHWDQNTLPKIPTLPPQVSAFRNSLISPWPNIPEDRYQSGADFSEDLGMIAGAMTNAEATVMSREDMRRSSKSAPEQVEPLQTAQGDACHASDPRDSCCPQQRLLLPKPIVAGVGAVGVLAIAAVIILNPFGGSQSSPPQYAIWGWRTH